jgi:hypothetical protein
VLAFGVVVIDVFRDFNLRISLIDKAAVLDQFSFECAHERYHRGVIIGIDRSIDRIGGSGVFARDPDVTLT